MKIKILKSYWLVLPLAFIIGCETYAEHPVLSGVLATPGCTIEAEDGSFKIVSGQNFRPPWQAGHCYNTPRGLIELANQFKGIPEKKLRQNFNVRRVLVSVPGENQPLHGILMLCKIPDGTIGAATRSYQIEIPQDYVNEAKGGRISLVYETVWRQTPSRGSLPPVSVDDNRNKVLKMITGQQGNTNLTAEAQQRLSKSKEETEKVFSQLEKMDFKYFAWILWLSDKPF